MKVLPAIDLLDGRPVRLRQGDFEQVTRFDDDAVALARRFEAAGAEWLHVVDLDGARAGRWRNLEVIARLVAATSLPVQAGGGARETGDIEAALELGVERVVVGTAAVASPAAFERWAARYGDRIAVSLDVRGDRLAVRGWTAESADSLLTVASALEAAGARRFIHTNVSRDGTLGGVDLAGLQQLLPLGLPVIVAGGIAGLDDVRALRDAGAEGAIIGRALLDGSLDLVDVLRVAAGQPEGRPAV
ncbi:MAG TPA: 1-(5-phosphoribosyl)-5-[(5-phosphoribosylamino)methylideneamino]imidazole-4-carboxamide isomerase [Candidatus Dormibacteraeota bacterium]|jgi:phosphoribosylformimino-5-aminoimidazole carboxamide ribotide isomerase|nr:1-(5-phosphoribosyl)-5-[(5-phosphoribosylamino)methylideneamino]imidazole-4-carboxamide isomerase [Candidatus Dormibacteraeota bacterium]